MFEKCLLIYRSRKCVYRYGISTKLQLLPLSSCFALLCATGKQLRSCVQTDLGCLYLCWPQNLESREVIGRETWAVWVQASWMQEQSRSSAQLQCSCHAGAALLLPNLSWQVPAPLCSPGRKKGDRHPSLLPEGWDQTAVCCQITTAGFSSASILLQAWVWIVWNHRLAWVCWQIPSAFWFSAMPVLVQRVPTYHSQERVLCAGLWQLFKHWRAQPWKFTKNQTSKCKAQCWVAAETGLWRDLYVSPILDLS